MLFDVEGLVVKRTERGGNEKKRKYDREEDLKQEQATKTRTTSASSRGNGKKREVVGMTAWWRRET